MAEGIRKRHSKGCPAREGGRCRCNAGWEASIYLAREGRKIRRTFAREAEAKSWRRDALASVRKGGRATTPADNRTLYDVLVEFVSLMESGVVRPRGRERYKPNTVRSYERAVRLHLRGSELAALRPADVRRRDVQAYADGLLAAMSASSVGNALNPLQAYYGWAIHREALTTNPTEGIDLPADESKRPRRIVAPEQAVALIAALPVEDRPLWATAFYAGLRRGELQALRCEDIDLAGNVLYVRKGWDQIEGEIEPKSNAARRTIPILAILGEHLRDQLRRTGRSDKDRIFGRSARQVFYASTADGRAKRAWIARNATERAAADEEQREPELLTLVTMHECRHTFASLLIEAGANPKAIQEIMGHSNIQTTFDVYGHLLPGSRDEVRVRMDAFLASRSDRG